VVHNSHGSFYVLAAAMTFCAERLSCEAGVAQKIAFAQNVRSLHKNYKWLLESLYQKF